MSVSFSSRPSGPANITSGMASRNRFPIEPGGVRSKAIMALPSATQYTVSPLPRTRSGPILDRNACTRITVSREFLTCKVGISYAFAKRHCCRRVTASSVSDRPPDRPSPGLGSQVPGSSYYRVEDPHIITEMSHGFHVLA